MNDVIIQVLQYLPHKSYGIYNLLPLNKSYRLTGVLYDRFFPFAHMDEHTGLSTTKDATSSDHFKQGYYECTIQFIIQLVLGHRNDLENMLETFPDRNGHPIGILYYKFDSLDTNALQDHLLDTLSNGQFIDEQTARDVIISPILLFLLRL